MIIVLDNFECELAHGEIICKIIKNHTRVPIRKINIPNIINSIELYELLNKLRYITSKKDVLLITWSKEPDNTLDFIVSNLGLKTNVVVSAGNDSEDINKFSPTRTTNITVVGCLNKKLQKASHSNYSDKDIKWIVGTTYDLNETIQNGTSVSAAIYTAFVANSIEKENSSLIEEQINQYHNSVKI